MTPGEIIDFWFSDQCRDCWFNAKPEHDRLIRERFESSWQQARDGELDDWEQTPAGALALVIILDQFPLNMFRDQPESFSTEAQSRAISGRAIKSGLDQQLPDEQKVFLYMPWMHSESLQDQDYVLKLFEQAGLMENHKWALHHHAIVERFGRFPHRNAILGRDSTPEEIKWLASPEGFNP